MTRKAIHLDPSKITQLQPIIHSKFFLITTSYFIDYIQIKQTSAYAYSDKLLMQPNEDLADFIQKNTPDHCDIFLALPNGYALGYKNPHTSLAKGALANRRMIALRCISTPATTEDVAAMFNSMYDIDINKQLQLINHLYALGEQADYLQIVDLKNSTHAQFNHLSNNYVWHSLYGTPNPGQFILGPSGETNVIVPKIAEKISDQIPLDITGTIILHGIPIVHHGVKSNLFNRQVEIYTALDSLRHGSIEVTIDNGKIMHLQPTSKTTEPAAEILEELFKEDEIYRFILELGFGLNENLILCPGNVAANEFYGGKNGSIHYGIGRAPHTDFHVDIVCPNAQLVTNNQENIFGPIFNT